MKKIFTLLFLAALSMGLYAEKQVSGVVVDAKGEPVIGASIQAKGTTQGTISDYDGKFEMEVPESVKTLVVSFVGMATQEVAAGKNIKVVMSENSEVIQEVVVTGYGTVAKGAYAGSAQAVKAEDIEKKNPSDVTKALAGEVAGVQVATTSGQPGTISSIRIRGIGSISASSAPLYVVDGIPVEEESMLSSIDPGDIASTTILKDATATSLYGSRGANGVVLITTKKGSSAGDDAKIEVDIKSGANMRLLPMYDVISSPEEYVVLCWQSLYNEQYMLGRTEAKAIQTAHKNLFGASGLPTIYNIWDQPGNLLINEYDAAGNVRPSFSSDAHRLGGFQNMDSWYNTLFHNGLKLEATAKISGGNEKLNYYTSFGYLKDEGYYTESDFQRFNTRANINYQAKKWLKGGLNIQYAYSRMSNPVQDDKASNNGFLFVNQIPPIFPVYVHDPATGEILVDPKTGGKMYDYGDNGNPNIDEEGGRPYSFGINPAGALQWDKNTLVRHQTAATAFLEFKLYEGLKLTVNAGLQYINSRYNSLTNKYYGDAAGVGRVSTTQYNQLAITSNQLLEYNKSINEHTIRVMAGHEINYYTHNMQYGYKKNIVLDNVSELSNAVSMDDVSGYARTSTLQSFLATATYEYDNRYLITGNYRADGSSKFAKGHRWGHFGSVGAAWNFTNEHFMEGTDAADWLKNGKLRLSWGVLGNQDIGDMLYTDHYDVENVNGEKGYAWSLKGNPELTWERTSTVDLGLEFAISKYLDVELDYFYKKTDNMLFPRYVAPSLGYSGYYVNDAAMMNQGVEFDLKAHALDLRNIKLDIRLNGGFYRNKMLQMPIDGYDDYGNPIRMVMSGGMSKGHSTADYYMVHYEGVNDEGEAMYTAYYDASLGNTFGHSSADQLREEGKSGDNYVSSVYEYKLKHPDAQIESVSVPATEYTYAGSNYNGKSYMPDLDGGFGIDFEAYGVTLSISCSYRIGGYGYDNQYALLMHSDKIGSRNWHADMRNAWTECNTNTNIPRLSNGSDKYANAASDRFLTSNSFLSLNNINLGYKFPKKWMEKIKLTNLQVWVAADNLAVASARRGYNPLMSFSGTNGYNDYSPLSTVMGGVKIQF